MTDISEVEGAIFALESALPLQFAKIAFVMPMQNILKDQIAERETCALAAILNSYISTILCQFILEKYLKSR